MATPRAHHQGVREVLDAGDAHPHHRVGEERVVRGDDEVAGPGQHQRRPRCTRPGPSRSSASAARATAGTCRGRPPPRGRTGSPRPPCRRGPTTGPRGAWNDCDVPARRADVVAGGEVLARAGQMMTLTSSSPAARGRRRRRARRSSSSSARSGTRAGSCVVRAIGAAPLRKRDISHRFSSDQDGTSERERGVSLARWSSPRAAGRWHPVQRSDPGWPRPGLAEGLAQAVGYARTGSART